MNAAAWDRWYQSLPEDLRRKLAVHDFRRLGDCFRTAFISGSAIAPAKARLILRIVHRYEDGDLGADTMAQAVSEEAQNIIDIVRTREGRRAVNDLPAPKIYALPPRAQAFKSWEYIAGVFQARAERERRLAWEQLGTGDSEQWHRHIARGEALDEAAAFCRGQMEGETA